MDKQPKAKMMFSKLFDHTLLKANATASDIRTLCEQAIDYNFYSVCVNGSYVKEAFSILEKSQISVVTVIGFPLGSNDTKVKEIETKIAIDNGASEIDMVVNLGMFFSNRIKEFATDIENVAKVCETKSIPLKTIIETSFLSTDNIKDITKICVESGSNFIKTSTGFSSRGVSKEDIITINETLVSLNKKDSVGIKASGGVRTLDQVLELVELGASRIGASASVAIVEEFKKRFSS